MFGIFSYGYSVLTGNIHVGLTNQLQTNLGKYFFVFLSQFLLFRRYRYNYIIIFLWFHYGVQQQGLVAVDLALSSVGYQLYVTKLFYWR